MQQSGYICRDTGQSAQDRAAAAFVDDIDFDASLRCISFSQFEEDLLGDDAEQGNSTNGDPSSAPQACTMQVVRNVQPSAGALTSAACNPHKVRIELVCANDM